MRRLTAPAFALLSPLAIVFTVTLAAHGCTPASSRVAADVVTAAGPALCALVPLLDGDETVAVLCADAAKVAAEALRASAASGAVHVQEKGAACVLVPLGRAGGDPRERVCERERDRVLRAIGGGR